MGILQIQRAIARGCDWGGATWIDTSAGMARTSADEPLAGGRP
jgi:hypothetical protein